MIFITQPTYLPWIGYFSFLNKASEIVFLDDVQFSKRSWQQRNRILSNGESKYLTIPVISKGRREQMIKDVKIYEKNFFRKHLMIIEHNYKKTEYFKEYFELLKSLNSQIENLEFLSEINILLIKEICMILNIKVKFSKSSSLNIQKKRSHKIVEICNLKLKKQLLSNEGTINYINHDKKIFEENDINVNFFKYDTIKYKQTSKIFIKELSILDLIFNEGPNSINIIKKGLKKI